jgi:predicted GNAT family N-acyltransferase
MSESAMHRPSPLTSDHQIAGFRCGEPELEAFLQRFALENQRGGKTRTFVATHQGAVIAYYSLAPNSVAVRDVPARIAAGQGRHDVPVILIGRLAVDTRYQGAGLGQQMLLDALLRSTQGAEIIGGRAILVHAKSAKARDFYLRHGFESASFSGQHLMMLIKDVRKTLGL